jgi:cobalamin biosynthesis protein CbiG
MGGQPSGGMDQTAEIVSEGDVARSTTSTGASERIAVEEPAQRAAAAADSLAISTDLANLLAATPEPVTLATRQLRDPRPGAPCLPANHVQGV